MELSEATQVIISYFEELGFMLYYEEEYDDLGGQWTLLFAPNDEGIIELAKKIKAAADGNTTN